MGVCNEASKRKIITDKEISKTDDSNKNQNKDISNKPKFERSQKRKYTVSK